MTTTASEQRRGGWLVLLLAAVLTFTTMVLLGATAGAGVASAATVSTGGGSSASSVPASQTRVGVSTSDSILVVGAHDSIAAGQGRGNLSSQSCFVSGCCVAAEEVAPQVLRVGDVKLPGVPKGAVGAVTDNGTGLTYAIPKGTPEIDPRVTQIRIMGPTTGKYAYPNGYAVYMNDLDQTVNPLTGQTISPSDPLAHIPLS